jgi:hypothetical protein
MTLLFDTRTNAHKLHADGCSMVNTAGTRYRVIREDVEDEVADLIARGFTIVRCKCLRVDSRSPAI